MLKQSVLVLAIIVLVAGNLQADLTDGLVGYWPFNGNANDESGGGNHGTVEGATLIPDRFGNPDSAYSFDGIDDRIVIGDVELVTGNTITVAAWFHTDTDFVPNSAWDQPIVSKFDQSRAYYLGNAMPSLGGKITFDVLQTSISTLSDNDLSDDQWHLAVGVYDGNLPPDNIKLYIDGRLQAHTGYTSGEIWDIPARLAIGALVSSGGQSYFYYFAGHIDDVRIYDRALSEAEVWELCQLAPPGQAPVADAGEDIVADADEEVTLDASASYDPNGYIAEYTWTVLPDDTILYSGQENTFKTKALGRVEETIKLTVTDNVWLSSEDAVSIFNRRVEDIELTPGPQGEQGPAGITPAEIADMQAQITALQQANAALLLQIQALEQQNALLQQAINDNRYLLEQLPQLQKKLEELEAVVEEETP
ncbi:MAG: LamG-like jellyroll fold domain-containing protein [Planctomycetota bacterium]